MGHRNGNWPYWKLFHVESRLTWNPSQKQKKTQNPIRIRKYTHIYLRGRTRNNRPQNINNFWQQQIWQNSKHFAYKCLNFKSNLISNNSSSNSSSSWCCWLAGYLTMIPFRLLPMRWFYLLAITIWPYGIRIWMATGIAMQYEVWPGSQSALEQGDDT